MKIYLMTNLVLLPSKIINYSNYLKESKYLKFDQIYIIKYNTYDTKYVLLDSSYYIFIVIPI